MGPSRNFQKQNEAEFPFESTSVFSAKLCKFENLSGNLIDDSDALMNAAFAAAAASAACEARVGSPPRVRDSGQVHSSRENTAPVQHLIETPLGKYGH